MEFRDYPKGAVLTEEGKYEASLFIIVQGSVRATTKRQDGKDRELSVTEGGGVLGEMALLTGCPRSATLVALSNTQCLHLPAEKFRRFLPFAPEMTDDIIILAKARRTVSVEANAEMALTIPDIDKDIDNKLYLYSLLRNHHDAMIYEGHPQSASESDVSVLQKDNAELSIVNARKRVRIEELRERMRALTNEVEHGGGGEVDLQLTLHAKTRQDLAAKKMVTETNMAKEMTTIDEMKTAKLQRRNSWASNTRFSQHKEVIVRILSETFRRKKLESLLSDEQFVAGATSPNGSSSGSKNGGTKRRMLSSTSKVGSGTFSLGEGEKEGGREGGNVRDNLRMSPKSMSGNKDRQIDISLEGHQKQDCPTKMLGGHLDQYSAVASSRHLLDFGKSGGGGGEGGEG